MMFYELPMNRSIVARAHAVVVHSGFARVKVLAQEPSATVVHIPHHLSSAALETDLVTRREARSRLGLDPDTLLFMSMGFVTQAKQIEAVLRALDNLRDVLPPFQYLIAGEARPDQYDVEADIARYALGDIVSVTGYVPDELFFNYIAAADIIINLRYPTGGETSGTLIRALGSGACAIVIDHGPFTELPDSAAVKVPWGPDFEVHLQSALLELGLDPDLRSIIGEAARMHVRSVHAIERSADAYRDTIATVRQSPRRSWTVTAPWEFATAAAHEEALARLKAPDTRPGALWWRQAVVPTRGDEPVCVVVCATRDDCARYLSEIYGHIASEVEWLPVPSWINPLSERPRRACDLLLVVQPIRQISELWRGLVAANRAVALGGILVLDLWHDNDDEVPRGLTHPNDIDELLLRAGFRLRRRWIGPEEVSFAVDLADPEAWMRTPTVEVCWQVVKISEFIDPPGQWCREIVTPSKPNQPITLGGSIDHLADVGA
ncbi:hypothetical protein C0V82_26055 (plasmid) [Niveispirillum cyanobacteriorum]|uniref:Glycosyl transferase family 1 domain-containing protein n=2 Tax=Niveispirillum cyanobacteriorum TaxID=1612173 RepID=A0A2K9NNG2_9PROT|nr:hypothetical protein C0V82_26055 [Niveispirillum cyanobacteriorum]